MAAPLSKVESAKVRRHLTLATFDYEPSKVETQLKENIQRLHTPADETPPKTSLSISISNDSETADYRSAGNEESAWEIPFEDIRELEYVGSGGQGTVFSGIYRGKMVAVKKVIEQKQTDIHHLRKLEHKNIIRFLGVCTKEPCYCIVMEYCNGGNVYQYIRTPNLIMLPKQVVNWAEQVARGMNYLHSNMIIHRDLKSLNVLVEGKNSLKITDFGTSRIIGCNSTVMTVVGSCAWMAPELIRNEPCNEKVDVWSYGILLWELLTQESPYKSLNHGAIMFGVGSNRLSLPVPTKCPEELKTLLNSCWQPEAKNRPCFKQILEHLHSVKKGLYLSYTTQDYLAVREKWRNEIDQQLSTFEKSLNVGSSNNHQLVLQRKDELKHAQDVRNMYEKRLETAEKLCEQLDHCKRLLDQRQNELNRKERELTERLEQYKEILYISSSSDEDERNINVNNNRKIRRSRSGRRMANNHSSNCSISDHVFESPLTTQPQPIPRSADHSPNLSGGGVFFLNNNHRTSSISSGISGQRRSDSIITDDGNVSPAVKKFINSVTQRRACPVTPGGQHNVPRITLTKHRRVKSCSVPLKRRDSTKSHDLSHDRSYDQSRDQAHDTYSCNGSIGWRRRGHRSNGSKGVGSPDNNKQGDNGSDGDTESNGDGEDDFLYLDSMSSSPSDISDSNLSSAAMQMDKTTEATPTINRRRPMSMFIGKLLRLNKQLM